MAAAAGWSSRACPSVPRWRPGSRIPSCGRRGRRNLRRTLGAPSLSGGAHDEVLAIVLLVRLSPARAPRRDQRLTAESSLLRRYHGGAGRPLDEYSEPLSEREPTEPVPNLEASCLVPVKPSPAPVPILTGLLKGPGRAVSAGRRAPAGLRSC